MNNKCNSDQLDLGKIYGMSEHNEENENGNKCMINDIPSLNQIKEIYMNSATPNEHNRSPMQHCHNCTGPEMSMMDVSNSSAMGSIPMNNPPMNSAPMNNNYMRSPMSVATTPINSVPESNLSITQSSTIPPVEIEFLPTPLYSGLTNNAEAPQAITEYNQPAPNQDINLEYMNSFLRTQIGRLIEVNSMYGNNAMETHIGYLYGVGSDYLLLKELNNQVLHTIDYYSIKTIRLFYE